MASRANLKTVISADMSAFSATMRRAGATASATGSRIGKSMAGATRVIGNVAKAAALAGVAMAAVGAALAGRAFVRGIKNAADLGGKLSDVSAQTGIAAGQLALMQRAFEDNGISADKVGTSVNKLQRMIVDLGTGSAAASRPFDALGISFAEISALSPDKQFELVQKRIAAIQDPALRAATAMQIFGRSGGEMLTLFADGNAFGNAAKSLGTQAEILNRRAADFDAISDSLNRAGVKMQGFFVGVLDKIADPLLAVLTKFEELDLAAMGQAAGDAILAAVKHTLELIDNAYQFGQTLKKWIDFSMASLRATLSPQFWEAVGLLAKEAFLNAVNFLYRGLTASIAAGKQAFLSLGETALVIFSEIMKPSFWQGLSLTLAGVATSFGATFLDTIATIIKQLERIPGVKKLTGNSSGALAEQAEKLRGQSKDFASQGGDMLAPHIDAIRKAAAEIGGDVNAAFQKAFESTGDVFDTSGMAEKAGVLLEPIAAELAEILDRPIESIREKLGALLTKFSPQAEAGDAGSGGRAYGQAARPSGRAFGQAGEILGQDNIFAKDRARLGISSGLQGATGGLGAVRAVGRGSADKDAVKQSTLAEKQLTATEEIAAKIKEALTVS